MCSNGAGAPGRDGSATCPDTPAAARITNAATTPAGGLRVTCTPMLRCGHGIAGPSARKEAASDVQRAAVGGAIDQRRAVNLQCLDLPLIPPPHDPDGKEGRSV